MKNTKFRELHDKYETLGNSKARWLGSALVSAADEFRFEELSAILKASKAKRVEPGTSEILVGHGDDNWSPIPLDRSDASQNDAIVALEKTIEELRGDNGYAATNPDEKIFVQDKLAAVTKRLRDDRRISWMYLKEFAFKPLGILIERFGKAAIGTTATLAKEALYSWLKGKGIHFLDDFLK